MGVLEACAAVPDSTYAGVACLQLVTHLHTMYPCPVRLCGCLQARLTLIFHNVVSSQRQPFYLGLVKTQSSLYAEHVLQWPLQTRQRHEAVVGHSCSS